MPVEPCQALVHSETQLAAAQPVQHQLQIQLFLLLLLHQMQAQWQPEQMQGPMLCPAVAELDGLAASEAPLSWQLRGRHQRHLLL